MQRLELHTDAMRATDAGNVERLAYNRRVLTERASENAAALTQHARRLTKQRDALAELKARDARHLFPDQQPSPWINQHLHDISRETTANAGGKLLCSSITGTSTSILCQINLLVERTRPPACHDWTMLHDMLMISDVEAGMKLGRGPLVPQTQYAAAERRQAEENARLRGTVTRVSRQLDDLRAKYRRFERLETSKFERVQSRDP